MPSYTRNDAREWGREHLKGVCNVVIPTFTNDLQDVNEVATRFDVRREIELGFSGALVVAETATTPEEYVKVMEWFADEAAGRLLPIFHASFNTLEENVRLAQRSSTAGAELVLLSYPPTFYPSELCEVYEYTKAFCDRVDLAVMLFPVPLWGFERLHSASLPIEMMEQLVAECPNIVAIKAEGGFPGLGGFAQTWNRLSDQVVVTMPIESEAIPLATLVPLQFIATSNTECMGDRVPAMLRMCVEGKYDEVMELYWEADPIRRAGRAIGAVGGANMVHRMAWKYQAWLTGFNGGPLRQPTARLVSSQMAPLRAAARQAGVAVDDLPDTEFFVGRNPV